MYTKPKPNRKWYRMKRVWFVGAILAIGFLSSLGDSYSSSGNSQNSINAVNTAQYQQQTAKNIVPAKQGINSDIDNLSNNNYYTNSVGNSVHSPAYSNDGDIPAGASAQCGDGTYSFSQSRRGTCSHHGGVDIWY